MAKTVELKTGDKVCLSFMFWGQGMLNVHATVVQETEKAIKVSASDSDKGCWFPKKAVLQVEGENFASFARWFRFDDYAQAWFNRHGRKIV